MKLSKTGLVCLFTVLCSGVSRGEGPTDSGRLAELVLELRHPDEKNRRLAAYGLEHFDYTKSALDVEEAVGLAENVAVIEAGDGKDEISRFDDRWKCFRGGSVIVSGTGHGIGIS